MRYKSIMLCFWAALPVLSHAQIELVADLGSSNLDAFPRDLTACGDKLFFTAYTAAEGWELWVTDGTQAGSHMVKDINPGPAHGTDFGNYLTAVGNTLFFMARDAEHGRELWKSDGTEAGTVMVADIWAGPSESIPTKLFALGSVVVFTAENANGRRLYASDGGSAMAITDHSLDFAASVAPLVVGDMAYFSAWTPITNNYSLWSTSGASATLVKNIAGGFGQSAGINELTLATGGFYFRANTPGMGPELWRSNGTEGGTALVSDMLPGESGLDPRYLVVMGGDLYFVGQNGVDPVLYKLVGDAAVMVSPLRVHVNNGSSYPVVRALDDRILFMHHDPATGLELYVSDGTSGGTGMVKDIFPGDWDGMGELAYMFRADDHVYFTGNTPGAGRELWKTDGTEAGTVQVADIYPGSSDARPKMFTRMGDHLYFHASGYTNAQQLYRTSINGGMAITEPPIAPRMLIFPNPCSGTFNAQGAVDVITARSMFHMIDGMGRTVPLLPEGVVQDGSALLHSGQVSPGYYILQVTDAAGRRHTVPVVIE